MLIKTKHAVNEHQINTKYEFVSDAIFGMKAKKSETVYNAVVEAGGFSFDADEQSMARLVRVVAIHQGNALLAISNGEDAATAAAAALSATVSWKCADDVVRDVSVQTLLEALSAAQDSMAEIWL